MSHSQSGSAYLPNRAGSDAKVKEERDALRVEVEKLRQSIATAREAIQQARKYTYAEAIRKAGREAQRALLDEALGALS